MEIILQKKINKFVDFKVKHSEDIIKTSSCALTDFYNDIILIKSIIDNNKDVDVFKGYEYVNTEDKILLLYNYIEANYFLKASTKIERHTDDKSEKNFYKTSNRN